MAWALAPYEKSVTRPNYLVVLLPDAVRVDGAGFYTLAAGAPNPAGVRFGHDRTRAIAPLHTAFADVEGEIDILPYVAGPLELEWAIVASDGCTETISARGKLEPIAIAGDAPELVSRDEFSAQRPDKVVRALAGPYKLHVFKDRFEVLDAASGALVLRHQGTEPTFSPTGRFLSVTTTIGETFEVFDLLAGRNNTGISAKIDLPDIVC